MTVETTVETHTANSSQTGKAFISFPLPHLNHLLPFMTSPDLIITSKYNQISCFEVPVSLHPMIARNWLDGSMSKGIFLLCLMT